MAEERERRRAMAAEARVEELEAFLRGAPAPQVMAERRGTKLSWRIWNEVPHPDGMAIYDPDGFRGGKPTVVTWDEFERARMECTLVDRREIGAAAGVRLASPEGDAGLDVERLAERLHERYAGALCISDLGWHKWADCDAKAQWKADSAALTSPVKSDELAWLIEKGQPEGYDRPIWWADTYDNSAGIVSYQDRWTRDAWEAIRFPSKAAAEEMIAGRQLQPARAVEHGFVTEPRR